ncbi:MAG: PPOX class F420-dependent oxidoreductase [Halioglobus sp.]
MKPDEIEFLEGGSYLSFATLKKSGDFVATPVWFAPDGDDYYLFSAKDAGKVKRLRNFSQCTMAACTVNGKVTGESMDGQAYLLTTAAEEKTALAALHRKYGWQMKMADFFSKLSGKYNKRTYIRVAPQRS